MCILTKVTKASDTKAGALFLLSSSRAVSHDAGNDDDNGDDREERTVHSDRWYKGRVVLR